MAGTLVEQATSLDLQPADASGQPRTLQASYICEQCRKRYKPTLEIIALLITGIFGVLTPAFAFAKLVAEWYVLVCYLLMSDAYTSACSTLLCRSSSPPESTMSDADGKMPLASPGIMQQVPQQPYQPNQPYQGQPYQGQPYPAGQPYNHPGYGQV